MRVDPETDDPLPAGDFSAWLTDMQAAIRGERESDVPCDGCTACCKASQFIHIAPDEGDALAHIPDALLFPAPMLPAGNVLLGYDERGHCPMLVDDRCSIYDHRPRTCRTYDCRVFPATGVELGDGSPIAPRARRWRFEYPTSADVEEQRAVRAAVAYLDECRDDLPAGSVPTNPPQLAVLAIEISADISERDE